MDLMDLPYDIDIQSDIYKEWYQKWEELQRKKPRKIIAYINDQFRPKDRITVIISPENDNSIKEINYIDDSLSTGTAFGLNSVLTIIKKNLGICTIDAFCYMVYFHILITDWLFFREQIDRDSLLLFYESKNWRLPFTNISGLINFPKNYIEIFGIGCK